MERERRDLRTKSDSHCLLMGLDGVTYQAQLGDISIGGALIMMSGDVSYDLHVGDMCGLMLSDSFNMSSEKHTGKIVRLETGSVGVSFHNQEHIHQKKKFIPPS
jgi:c-di-GMP-binding flagellar brake protein YcgR